jgi:glycosyltransferase involved in cell wall biosynthesis
VRIGYTCHDVFPATTTNTQQIFWTLLEVAALGHSIDLYVPAVRGGQDARAVIARHYGVSDGMMPDHFRIAGLAASAGSGMLARGRFDLVAAERFSLETHDLLWTRDPIALVAGVRRGMPAVFETYRLDFASAPELSFWRLVTLRKAAFAGVIAHSSLTARAFVAAGVDPARVLVAHNGFAPLLMEPKLSRAAARAAVGLPAAGPIALYAGHVGPKKGTNALIQLAAAVPDVTVVILGVDERSAEGRWVFGCVQQAGVGNVRLLPRVPVGSVAAYLYAADCLLVPPTSAPLERFGRTVLPMKLFPYMASGTPILAPKLPDIEEVLEHDRTSVLVPPNDPEAAAQGLRHLLEDRARAERLGVAAEEESRKYTWAARARTIAAALERWHR